MTSPIPRPPRLKVPNYPLPSLTLLGTDPALLSLLDSSSAASIAETWFAKFSLALGLVDVPAVTALILPSQETTGSDGNPGTLLAHWRDHLALTWDLRTFSGLPKIATFLEARLASTAISNVRREAAHLDRVTEVDDVLWIRSHFVFETNIAKGTGIVRLVPVPGAGGVEWKAHTIYTTLVSLTSFPELSGAMRNDKPNHGLWASQRAAEMEYRNADGTPRNPQVFVIGAGQSGLAVAARLKYLGVDTLIVEKNKRVGDNWRGRYEALCLHDPVWYDHLPYIPEDFHRLGLPMHRLRSTIQLANWLEFYADSLELNVWTSTTIDFIIQDDHTKKWNITVTRVNDSGEEVRRNFVVNHVVFAGGIGAGIPNIPDIKGMETFKGQILHSTQHKSARDHVGKKVVVVGTGTSAHDIAVDYYNNGVDVTMVQRGPTYIMSTKNGWDLLFKGGYSEGGPPVDAVDLLTASMPLFMAADLQAARIRKVAEMDRDLLDGLHKVGFRTNLGIKDTGFTLLARSKAGGYYLDVGASALISSGDMKLKSSPSGIAHFTPTGLAFPDGSTLAADVVLFATGLGSPEVHIQRVFGWEVLQGMYTGTGKKPGYGGAGGLDREGEVRGAWRPTGVHGLWYTWGNLAASRFHSKHVALQIKAMEEGIHPGRYQD